MKIIADLHTHTNISEHAFSTLEENCIAANKAGLQAVGITNHGPALEDGASHWHFKSLGKNNPGKMHGVYLISGIELNIMQDGKVDLEEEYMEIISNSIENLSLDINNFWNHMK